MLYSDSLREMMQNGLNESFWDGLGVEFKPKYIFDFRSAPREGSGVRAGRGDTGSPWTGGHGGPRDGRTRRAPGWGDTRGPKL